MGACLASVEVEKRLPFSSAGVVGGDEVSSLTDWSVDVLIKSGNR